MWRYKQPGFALRLLCELQKQQQHNLHCDTLLQTEGVTIPAHSCVLSALSPVFCRAFANAPSLPMGQSRLVQLEAVGAHALMKLVGFMYSGEIVGENLNEQLEVNDIAFRLGFSNFMEGKQKQVNMHQNKTASWKEIGLQTEETARRKQDASVQIQSEKKSFSHSETQTDSAEAHVVHTCVGSRPELSIDLPDELSDVPSKHNSTSPNAGLSWIDEIVAHSPPNSTEALVRVQAKYQPTQREKKRAKITKKQGSTQIALKIKLKRQKSGALWEIVSVQEDSAADGSFKRRVQLMDPDGTCGSSDVPPVMPSLPERSVEIPLRPSSSLTCQSLETVMITPPSELLTPLPATPTKPPSELFCLHTIDPVPLSSPLQMPPLSPRLSQPEESEEHIAKLLEMVTVGSNILPLVTVEGNSNLHSHLDQPLEKCAGVANSPAAYLCLLGQNVGATGFGTTSGTSEQRESGSEDLFSYRKWDLNNVASVANYPTLFSCTSPCTTQKKNTESSCTPKCTEADIVPSKLAFGTEGLQHQNVPELKTALNNLFWGADTYAKSWKQTRGEANEDCDVQTQISRTAESNAAQDDPTPVGEQCLEQLLVTDQVSVLQSSDVGQDPNSDDWADFSWMRLPRCLSPLTSEVGETIFISTQDSLRPLEFSSCFSASHANLQPTLRCKSSPFQPQALPGKSNQQNPSCTFLRINELHCSVVGKNSCSSRSNSDHSEEASESKLKMRDFEHDNIQDLQMNESVVGGISTATNSAESVIEPYRKKAKMAGYPNGIDTQTVKVINPCSPKIKNIQPNDDVEDVNNPVTSEKMDCLNASKKTVTIDLKSQEKLALCPVRQPYKCEGQEACQKYDWDTKQPVSMVEKRGCRRPLEKRTYTKAVIKDLSKISKLNSSSAVINASSSSSHHNLQLKQIIKECAGSAKVQQHPIGFEQAKTKVKDFINEYEKTKVQEPEMEITVVEAEKATQDVNLSRKENKQPKKIGFWDKIFHQTVFSGGTTSTQNSLPINPQLRTVLQTTASKISPSTTCKMLREPHMSSELMMHNNKQEKRGVPGTDKSDEVLDKDVNSKNSEQVRSSPRNVDGCLMNGNIVEAEISTNTGLSIHEARDLNAASDLCTLPPARDFNNNFGMDNTLQLQHESTTTLLHPFRPENMLEKPNTVDQITDCLVEDSVSIEPTEVKLIKITKEGTGKSRSDNLEGQELWNKVKEKENTVRKAELVRNEYEATLSDSEVDVMDESAQLVTGHGDEVIATGGNVEDIDLEESQTSFETDNDGEALTHEEEVNGQQVLRTEVKVMPPDEATLEMTSEMLKTKAPSIQHGEEPDLSSSSANTVGFSALFQSAEEYSSTEEEIVVDDVTDSAVEPCTVVGIQCNTILEEDDDLKEVEEEEEEEVDVTGEESN